MLTMEQRSAIVDFLSVYMGKEKKVMMQSVVHPSLQSVATAHTMAGWVEAGRVEKPL